MKVRLFADPIADIAVLGSPDNQALSEQADFYEQLVGGVRPPIGIGNPPPQDHKHVRVGNQWIVREAPGRGTVRVLSLEGRWLKARVKRYKYSLSVEPPELIVSATDRSRCNRR
jgi:hypothetical protein